MVNMMTENPENTPSAMQGFPNLIREGGRTVGSGRVAAIIEKIEFLKIYYNLFSKIEGFGISPKPFLHKKLL